MNKRSLAWIALAAVAALLVAAIALAAKGRVDDAQLDDAISSCMRVGKIAKFGFETPPPAEFAEGLVELRESCEKAAEFEREWFMENYGSAQ